MTVIRYIHQNPVKAGLLDSEFILSIFADQVEIGVKRFREFDELCNEDQCLDETDKPRLTDEAAKREIMRLIPENDIGTIKNLSKAERDRILRKVKGLEGITQRQAAHILGISPNLIFRA